MIKTLIAKAVSWLNRHYKLKKTIVNAIDYFPVISTHLRKAYRKQYLQSLIILPPRFVFKHRIKTMVETLPTINDDFFIHNNSDCDYQLLTTLINAQIKFLNHDAQQI